MIFVIFIYVLFAAVMAGFDYLERVNREEHFVIAFMDVLYPLLVGMFFPVAVPFSLLSCYSRKLKGRKENK